MLMNRARCHCGRIAHVDALTLWVFYGVRDGQCFHHDHYFCKQCVKRLRQDLPLEPVNRFAKWCFCIDHHCEALKTA